MVNPLALCTTPHLRIRHPSCGCLETLQNRYSVPCVGVVVHVGTSPDCFPPLSPPCLLVSMSSCLLVCSPHHVHAVPPSLRTHAQSYSIDAFALGLSIAHLLTGHKPYEELLESVKCPDALADDLLLAWQGSYSQPTKGRRRRKGSKAAPRFTCTFNALLDVLDCEEVLDIMTDTVYVDSTLSTCQSLFFLATVLAVC